MEEDTVIPLAENNIDLLVARFGAMPSLMLPDTIEKFQPSSAAIAYTAHMDRYGLSNKILGRSREVDPTTARQVTISRPPIDNCSWWVDLSDDSLARLLALPMAHRAKKLTLYACKDEVTAAAIKKRNYSNQSMEWHEDETNLPPAIKGTKTHEDGPDDVEPEAPTIPRVPTKLPDGVKGQTPRWAASRSSSAWSSSRAIQIPHTGNGPQRDARLQTYPRRRARYLGASAGCMRMSDPSPMS